MAAMEDDIQQLGITHSGLVARSPQGHAATSMPIKGNEDIWVEIQAHTFRNWVNDMIKDTGYPAVDDLTTDLSDGVRLLALVVHLQKRRLRIINRPVNQHQMLENVTNALNAITEDGIKLVNIGNLDIVNGNLKLILGLIWSLIVHYQIGRSKFPPKKLMLAWLRAVLPETGVNNFTTDWNSGVRLAALLDYCRPGLFPDWRELDPNDSIENCRKGMELATQVFGIPNLLEPEYLASPFLDELSGMTYLSYFMKENSPGFHATLRWVTGQLPNQKIKNFTTDWNDGHAVCNLVKSLGGPVPGFKDLTKDPEDWEKNLELGIRGGEKLGVEPVLRAADIADPNVEHLGVMAYAAYFQWIRPRMKPCDRIRVVPDGKTCRVNTPANFKIEYLCPDIDLKEITAAVRGPNGADVECHLSLGPNGGTGYFVPTQVGMHELTAFCEEEPATGCPVRIRALPDTSQIMFSGMDPCAVGSIVEVLINSNGAGGGDLKVEATSPTDRILQCPVNCDDGVYTATFQPDEAGTWKISVTYEDEHIQDSPFTCFVFDPHAVTLAETTGALPGQQFTFVCDARDAGWGEAKLDIVYRGRSLPHHVDEVAKGLYHVTFTPQDAGKHRVYVYYNGIEVKASPFSLRVDKLPADHGHNKAAAGAGRSHVDAVEISAEKLDATPVEQVAEKVSAPPAPSISSTRRHLTELNANAAKLQSPEKVQSIRRNSMTPAGDGQTLSSLMRSSETAMSSTSLSTSHHLQQQQHHAETSMTSVSSLSTALRASKLSLSAKSAQVDSASNVKGASPPPRPPRRRLND